ncbi:LacI family DNA-binding transcriptional regulator [Mycetocola spongiae]|uniref:LacI family DNA-binding transcriptional regulator n=1 Tax=Mycetocola spongiae TaxID=2859226 RepID=UPI001CF1EA1E|nr:LacI family DNA-binding transcriptional regulator [Mycetocola spongiae]UCR88210.1 LacI family DNA-binding transcriptional regulator [Mycetocola spongiae]
MDSRDDPAQSRITLAAVAARAGVSPSTASLAFSGRGPVSDATREKVLATAREMNYAGPDPRAQSLRRGSSGIVGALISDRIGVSFRDPVLIQTLDGLAEELTKIGASLLLIPESESGSVTVATAPIDALVMMCASADAQESARTLACRGIPVIQVEGPDIEDAVNIRVDNRGGSRQLAQHLRDLGHTRVAVVTLGVDRHRRLAPLTPEAEATATVETTMQRLHGVREVFPEVGGMIAGSSRVDAGRAAALALLSVERELRPTAIIAQSDLLASGVLAAAEELGLRVPEDLSVVGFDGIRVDGLERRLTTVWQPAQGKGLAAGRTVLAMLAGEAVADTDFEVSLILGDTSGPVPAAAPAA